MEDDMEDLKNSLNFVTAELSKLVAESAKQQASIVDLTKEIMALQSTVKERDLKIAELEKRLDDVEQYTRMEDVIISGLKVKPRSYARAAAADGTVSEDAPLEEQQTLEMQVIAFFNDNDIVVDQHNIAACHTLPSKDRNVKPAIIMRFANRKYKDLLLKQGKKLKGTDVYINEHLTKKNGDIAKQARFLRKQKKIQSTWTRNCKVMIKLNGDTPEVAKVLTVRDIKELDTYK